MPQYFSLNSNEELDNFNQEVGRRRLAGKQVIVSFEAPLNHRTAKQNNSLHQWLRDVAQCLNDNNLDARVVLSAEIDWNENMVKEKIWRPVQEVVTGETSTTKPEPKYYNEIYQTLCRHFASKHAVQLPAWPDRFHNE